MKRFKEYLEEKGRCWTGYKPVPGKKPYSDDSCKKEEVKEETIHVGHRNSKGDWIKTSTHSSYADAKKAMADLEKQGKKGVQHRYDNKGDIDAGMRKLAHEEVELDETAAWQRKEGKNPEGGLNQKGVESYRRENPGSKLQTAVTTKPSKLKPGSKSANRRKSFCARMSGMKKRLTSAKTANDPDSRINKSLRKWNC